MLNHLTKQDISEISKLSDARNEAEKGGDILSFGSGESNEKIIEILEKGRPHYVALAERIESLSSDATAELLAVMWLGRGDAKASEFDKLLSHAKSEIDENVHFYIASKSPLGKYLKDGMSQLA